MSVSEWTEGLKKKEASLIYVNPSVGFADSSPCGEPFGCYHYPKAVPACGESVAA